MCIIFTTRYHAYSLFLKFRYSSKFNGIELLIRGRIKLLYMKRNIFCDRYRFSLLIIHKYLEMSFDIFCICAFEVICWSMVSPRTLKSSTLTNGSPVYSNFGIWLIISRSWLWNTMYFVFLALSNYSFSSSHFCISFNSSLITRGRENILSGVFCSPSKEQRVLVKFVSSAKSIGWKCLQALWISFI